MDHVVVEDRPALDRAVMVAAFHGWNDAGEAATGATTILRMVLMGAFLADVPHTGPVPLLGTATNAEVGERLGLAVSGYEGPTGIVLVVAVAATEAGIPAASFWAATPHYAPPDRNPKVALALLELVSDFTGVAVDIGPLRMAAEAWERRADEIVRGDEALRRYVEKLQRTGPAPPIQPPSGEALAAEVEQYLREQDGDSGDG